jgi:hypothetical protein
VREGLFFFEKKNQKTFGSLRAERDRREIKQSLFASFSSEKEESFCKLTHRSVT